MGFRVRDRIAAAWDALRGITHFDYFSGGFGPTGGPLTSGAWLSQRAPSPERLVEAYKSICYACANINALAVASLPLRLYAVSGKGVGERPRSACNPRAVTRDRQLRHLRSVPHVARAMTGADRIDEVTVHPLLDALDDPNEEFDRQSLLYYTGICLDVAGYAYWRMNPPAGLPVEFWPLEPHHVRPVRRKYGAGEDALIKTYTYFAETIPAQELVRIKLVGLRDPYGPGYSPTQAAFNYAGLEDKWISIQDQLLGIGPRPGMIFSPKDAAAPIGPDERARVEAELNRKYSGLGAGRLLVVSQPMVGTPVTYPPSDVGNVEISRYDLERTANCFGVPLAYLTSESNLANLQAAERQHGRMAVAPRGHAIAARLTREARRFDPRLVFCFDPAVGEDEEREAKIFDMKLKNGSATINEARAEDGWEPKPWGDEPWLNSNLRQPSEERPKPVPPPGAGTPPKAQDDAKEAGDDSAEENTDGSDRGLLEGVTRILARIEGTLQRAHEDDHADPAAGHGHGGGGTGGDDSGSRPSSTPPAEPDPGGEEADPWSEAGELLWTADRDPDHQEAPPAPERAGEGDPGDDPEDRDGPAG